MIDLESRVVVEKLERALRHLRRGLADLENDLGIVIVVAPAHPTGQPGERGTIFTNIADEKDLAGFLVQSVHTYAQDGRWDRVRRYDE